MLHTNGTQHNSRKPSVRTINLESFSSPLLFLYDTSLLLHTPFFKLMFGPLNNIYSVANEPGRDLAVPMNTASQPSVSRVFLSIKMWLEGDLTSRDTLSKRRRKHRSNPGKEGKGGGERETQSVFYRQHITCMLA